jgi:hypothetical protein
MAAIIGDFAAAAFLDLSPVVGNGGWELPDFLVF